jgi:hypothetical protein
MSQAEVQINNDNLVSWISSLISAKSQDSLSRCLSEATIQVLYEAELKGPGSAKLILNERLANLKQINQSSRSKATKSDLDWLISLYSQSIPSELLKDLLQLAGVNGFVQLSSTEKDKIILQKLSGYSFNVGTDLQFVGKYEKPRVVFIDGFVESISEVTMLFEQSHSSKEFLFLFHRGISDDVANTINVNWKRGTLRCIPVKVPFDIDGINMINDMAIASYSNLITSNLGMLISTVKYDQLSIVDEINITENMTSIVCNDSNENVKIRVSDLKNQRDQVNPEMWDLLDKRIRTLTPNLVVLKLPNRINTKLMRFQIDSFLRSYKSLVSNGVIRTSENCFLAKTVETAIQFHEKFHQMISNIGAVVVITTD